MLDLRGVARELLPEADRHRVLQVGPADLDDRVERAGPSRRAACAGPRGPGSGVFWIPSRAATWIAVGITSLDDWPMLTASLGWTGRLAAADAVVELLVGDPGDHLVGVHVRRGAAAGLEDVDDELVVVLAVGDRLRGLDDRARRARRGAGSRSMLTCAAAFLIRPIARMNERGNRSGLIWKFRPRRRGLGPVIGLDGTSISPIESRSLRVLAKASLSPASPSIDDPATIRPPIFGSGPTVP